MKKLFKISMEKKPSIFVAVLLALMIFSGCTERMLKKELTVDGGLHYYQGKPFSGIAFEMVDENNLLFEEEYKNGNKDGVTRLYKNGKVWVEQEWKNDKQEGITRVYVKFQKDGEKKWTEGWYDEEWKDGKLIYTPNQAVVTVNGKEIRIDQSPY
jgi:antitoxin component YwqK of YwqJK toxin-antitoxin module